ncbi:MAG: lipid-A-disaccharide synthase [Propylenella sp.]
MAERPLRFALVVGEESGDQLGAGLIDALRRARPDATFVGLAGERMKARGMQSMAPLGDVAVMGLVSVVRYLPRIVRRVYQLVDAVLAAEPDVLVIVDSPELTHAVARRVAKRRPELPIVDYVSPTVWAWRAYRARRMVRYLDHVLALLPFEPDAHRRLGGPPCTYVGHPLIERLDELRPAPGERLPLGEGPTLLVLPGSRRTEISRLMAPFGEAVRLIAEARPDVEVLLPAVPHLEAEIRARAAEWAHPPKLVLREAQKFAAFRRAHAALAASGTVSLELGLAGVPTVIAYRVDPVARALKHLFLRVPSIVLTNLILGENAVPEFLDGDSSPEVLARETLALLSDTPARRAQAKPLARLLDVMSLPGGVRPSDKAAEIVLDAAEHGWGRRKARLR